MLCKLVKRGDYNRKNEDIKRKNLDFSKFFNILVIFYYFIK